MLQTIFDVSLGASVRSHVGFFENRQVVSLKHMMY